MASSGGQFHGQSHMTRLNWHVYDPLRANHNHITNRGAISPATAALLLALLGSVVVVDAAAACSIPGAHTPRQPLRGT